MSATPTLLPLAVLLFLGSTGFVLFYAKRNTSFFIVLVSILSFALGSATVVILPIDLSYASVATAATTATSYGDNDANKNDDGSANNAADNNNINPTFLFWQITYWTTFFLAWFFLPIARESLHSGHFTLLQRLKDSIAKSIRGLCIMIGLGVFAIAIMAIHLRSMQLVQTVLPIIMALGNTYGLLLVSLLLGNGLVSIPKFFWREACPANVLRRIRIVACSAEEELFDAVMGLEDIEMKIEEVCAAAVSMREEGENVGIVKSEEGYVDYSNGFMSERKGRRATRCRVCCKVDEVTFFNECLEELVRRKNESLTLNADRRTGRSSLSRIGSGNDPYQNEDDKDEFAMDLTYLVTLNAQLKLAQERFSSAELRLHYLVEQSRLFSALSDGNATNAPIIKRADNLQLGHGPGGSMIVSLSSSSTNRFRELQCFFQRLWIKHLRFYTYRTIAIITGILSSIVLWSEVTLSVQTNLSPFSWILHALDGHLVLFQIAALVPLLYMSICVYTCLFRMSLLGPYTLRADRQSHGVALVFNAQYLVRLQFPLGYNYLLLLKYDMTDCEFNNVMSDMSTIPFFGTSFSVYAPLLILAVCIFTLYDVYPKLLNLLGIEHEDALLLDSKERLESKVNEGIQLMKREAERKCEERANKSNGSNPSKQRSPDKLALVGRTNSDEDIINGSCRGRYS